MYVTTLPAFNVKGEGKQVQAILSVSWMQKWMKKQLIAHKFKFTTGWEVGTIAKKELKCS